MKKDNILKYMYLLICIALTIFIVRYSNFISIIKIIFKLLLPIFIGFIYAWFVNPLVIRLWFSRKTNSIIVFITIITIIGLSLYFMIPIIYKEIKDMVMIIPNIINYIDELISKFNLHDYINISEYNFNSIPLVILDNIKDVICFVSTLIIGLMIGLYMCFEYDVIYNFIIGFVSNKKLVNELSDKVRCCIKGTLLVAFIVFVLDSLYFFVIKLDGALLLGLLCGLTDLIPYIGPYIGGLFALLVSLGQGGKLWIYTIIGCCFVQMLENNVLQPLILSKTTRLSPLLVLIGMVIFGKLFGILGMIVATPLVCVISILFKHYFNNKYFTNSKN
ncbi:MAG: AI-2E family transporter [Candidatus Coprovivens sp.]